MSFDEKLFELVRSVFPDTTQRTFSSDCGKSASYYGSIRAQNLSMSTSALVYLAEVLEYRKRIGSNITPQRIAIIEKAQAMIAEEIASRAKSIDSENQEVRAMILNALAGHGKAGNGFHWLPSVIVG